MCPTNASTNPRRCKQLVLAWSFTNCSFYGQLAHAVHGGHNVSSLRWYPDTGANSHVTPDLAGLNQVDDYTGSDRLQLANGTTTPIHNICSTTVTSNIINSYSQISCMFPLLLINCFHFINFVLTIMFLLNFTHLPFLSRIEPLRKRFSSAQSVMASTPFLWIHSSPPSHQLVCFVVFFPIIV